jgi:Helix-turn-helix domain of transposase family ISL3/zinc-finger of transposase IS204/IS1001/IS1096/IS1165
VRKEERMAASVWTHAHGRRGSALRRCRPGDRGVSSPQFAGETLLWPVRPAGSGYDEGEGRRRWRALDAGSTKVFLEADAPRVECAVHGPTVGALPWARHGARHTLDFDDQAAWLADGTSKSAVMTLMRVSWRTVGACRVQKYRA